MMEGTPSNNENALYFIKFCRSCRNRESFDAIAELAAELRRAYMVKGLQAQLDEKEAQKYVELVQKREVAHSVRQKQQEVLEENLKCQSEILRKSEEYRRQLDEQLTRKEEEKRVNVEEAREYRKFLEEVDRVREEQERLKALEEKSKLVERTKQDRLLLEEMREVRRQEECKAEEKKRLEDLKYLKELKERSKEVKRLRQEQTERRERVLLEITKIILDAHTRKREREERLIDLVAEEVKCELALREMEETMRRKKMQRELAATLQEQIVFAKQCKLRFVEEDKVWAEELMKKIMEDEKMARYTAEAKRRMKIQYRKDLESLIEHRHRIREKEIARIEKIAKEQQRLELLEAKRAKEERKHLLMIHAANIANFLNRATLTAEEQEMLDELIKKNQDSENIDNTNVNKMI